MSRITTIEPGKAFGALTDAYEKVRGARGRISNIWKMHSVAPEVLEAHLSLYRALMHGDSPLSRERRELIATTVSAVNGCHY